MSLSLNNYEDYLSYYKNIVVSIVTVKYVKSNIRITIALVYAVHNLLTIARGTMKLLTKISRPPFC